MALPKILGRIGRARSVTAATPRPAPVVKHGVPLVRVRNNQGPRQRRSPRLNVNPAGQGRRNTGGVRPTYGPARVAPRSSYKKTRLNQGPRVRPQPGLGMNSPARASYRASRRPAAARVPRVPGRMRRGAGTAFGMARRNPLALGAAGLAAGYGLGNSRRLNANPGVTTVNTTGMYGY